MYESVLVLAFIAQSIHPKEFQMFDFRCEFRGMLIWRLGHVPVAILSSLCNIFLNEFEIDQSMTCAVTKETSPSKIGKKSDGIFLEHS